MRATKIYPAETARLVEQTFRFLDDPELVIDWLQRLGCRCTRQENGQSWTIHGNTGMTCGISRGLDPIAVASALAFALAGVWWVDVFPSLMTAVSEVWGRQRKKQTKGQHTGGIVG